MASALDEDEISLSIPGSAPRKPEQPTLPQSARGKERQADVRAKTSALLERQTVSQQLGAYQIIRTLGEGSFGKVKLAVHQTTRQQVALKIINRKKLVTRDMAGRIEREIKYLSLLRHPHIIKL
jgi:carbon catabolite-derepressing protein kinase